MFNLSVHAVTLLYLLLGMLEGVFEICDGRFPLVSHVLYAEVLLGLEVVDVLLELLALVCLKITILLRLKKVLPKFGIV